MSVRLVHAEGCENAPQFFSCQKRHMLRSDESDGRGRRFGDFQGIWNYTLNVSICM